MLPLAVAVAAALIVVALDGAYLLAEHGIAQESRRLTVLNTLENIRTRLERTIGAAQMAGQGIAALVGVKPDLSEAEFATVAKSLMVERTGIRNIGLAFGTVITYVFPKETNAKILGVDYRDRPNQRDSVTRVIRTGAQEIDGPIPLLQGGTGVVIRVPVFVPEAGGARRYRAMVNVPIDLGVLLPGTKVRHDDDLIEIAVRKTDGAVVFGNGSLFAASPLALDVDLPGATWQIGAMPEGGWRQWPRTLQAAGLLGCLLSLLVGVSLYAILRAQQRIGDLNRLYRVLSNINREIIGQQNQNALFDNVCRIAVEVGGFRMAWVGLINDGRVVPVAQVNGEEYLRDISIVIGNAPAGHGPTGRAARDDALNICNDIANEPRMAPWRSKQLSAGYRASIGIPLRQEGRVVGVFTLYAGEPGFFDPQEVILLDEIGADISHALDSIARQAEVRALTDSLERRVAERTLQLRQTNADLESFCHSVSHDLKAPLRAISGFAEILLRRNRNALDDKGRHHLDNIRDAAERMSLLIEDLLSYARIGRGAVQTVAVPVGILLERISATLGERISSSGGVLEVDRALAVPVADPRLLEQILTNLVDNAFKYYRPGVPPRVAVSSREEGSDIVISVADNGIGIASEFHEKIFDVFQRLHSEVDAPGTGIGLAIVRKGVQLMGGEVTVESSPGQGSTFRIILPKSPIKKDGST
ncbi:MAG: ATP-binding protein [Rhodospirillaceae bacterium]